MKNIQKLEFYPRSKEESLPNFSTDFPYIASRANIDKYPGQIVPWHWHKAIELFYIESGTLEYYTPKGKVTFPAGTGGMVNSNVLHMTKPVLREEENIQLLHIFDPIFISGNQGSRIEQKYVMPIVTASQIELLALCSDNSEQLKILELIRKAFEYSEQEMGYEMRIRNILSEVWMLIFEMFCSKLSGEHTVNKNDERLKMMLIYIHEHFAEKITTSELAEIVNVSVRECFRLFQNNLHVTPTEYMNSYRLQEACRRLSDSLESITEIAYACGFGSSSYFCKVFREYTNCTPMEYRRRWQNSDTLCLK